MRTDKWMCLALGLALSAASLAQAPPAPPAPTPPVPIAPMLQVEGSLACDFTLEGFGNRQASQASELVVTHNFRIAMRFMGFKDLTPSHAEAPNAKPTITVRLYLAKLLLYEGPLEGLNGKTIDLDPMRTGGRSVVRLERDVLLGPDFLPGTYQAGGVVALVMN